MFVCLFVVLVFVFCFILLDFYYFGVFSLSFSVANGIYLFYSIFVIFPSIVYYDFFCLSLKFHLAMSFFFFFG